MESYESKRSTGEDIYSEIADGKTSMKRYKRELNDKIFFDQYGRHLYKDMEGKDVKLYVI